MRRRFPLVSSVVTAWALFVALPAVIAFGVAVALWLAGYRPAWPVFPAA